MSVLRDDPDLLRQLDAAHRPRVHDDRRGHPRAPPPPARARTRSSSPASTSTRRRSPASREEQGLEPHEYVDRIAARWRELPERLNASNDFFIRTTDDGHKRVRPGVPPADLRQRATSTRTSTRGSTASAARRSRPRTSSSTAGAREHGIEPEYIEEKNYFFRLSAYQDRLLALYDERPDFVLPRFRSNEARSFIERRARGHHRQPRRPAAGASRSRGIRTRSSTSGSTRSSTT